jgi:hypothetical protein
MKPLIGLIILVLDIIAIVDLVKSSKETAKKVLWAILIIILPFIGMVLYFLLGKKK